MTSNDSVINLGISGAGYSLSVQTKLFCSINWSVHKHQLRFGDEKRLMVTWPLCRQFSFCVYVLQVCVW